MIKEKIDKFIGVGERKFLDPEFVATYMDDVLNGFRRQFFDEYKDKRTLRLSSVGRCLRMQSYNILEYPKVTNITPRLKRIFHLGDYLEALIIALANHAGCNVHNQQAECVLEGVKGHIDGEYIHDGVDSPYPEGTYIVEVKSMSDFSFKKFKKLGITDDGFGYRTQANSYAYARDRVGVVWVCINKNNGELGEYVMLTDKDLAEQTVENIITLKDCSDPRVFTQLPVEEETWYKKCTGNKLLPFTCSTCDFVGECWNGVTKFERGGKIKHYAGDIIHGKWTYGGKIIK